jgi:type VI secretion system ImpM family protein
VFGWKKTLKPTVFALGKMAGHPEFLAAPDALATSLDRWLDSGWQAAHGLHGDAWDRAFAEGTTYGFLWSHGSKAGEVTCGVLAPSVDSIGRRYPFLVGSRLPSARLERGWSLMPLAAGAFLDEAHALMLETRASPLPVAELSQRLFHLVAPSSEDVDGADEAHTAWSAATSVEAAWSTIFSDEPLASAGRALGWVVEALRPWVGREWPATSLLLRLPMGEGGPAAAVVWFEIVRTILRWRQTVPTAFWAAEGSSLLLGIGPPTPAMLGELWWQDADDDQVMDVRHAAEAATTSEASLLLETHPTLTMAEFLTALAEQK